MKFYHVKSAYDRVNLTKKERSFILCNNENFDAIYEQFSIVKHEEESVEKMLDVTHFESHINYDVLSFSFFEWQNQSFHFEKVVLYFSKTFLIFVCNKNDLLFDAIVSDIKMDKEVQPNGVDTLTYVYYKSLDHMLTKMFASLDSCEQTVAQLEKKLIRGGADLNLEMIIKLKTMTFEAKRYLRLLTYIGDQIVSNDNQLVPEVAMKYFANNTIKINRLYEFATSLHEKTNHLMDVYNTSINEKSNNFLNKLTIITVFATPITVLSGIYGMNFVNMPELRSELGYFVLLGVILILLSTIYQWLKKSNML